MGTRRRIVGVFRREGSPAASKSGTKGSVVGAFGPSRLPGTGFGPTPERVTRGASEPRENREGREHGSERG